jgi:hypothetical protein
MSAAGGGSSEVIFLPPGGGRSYQAGPMRAVFKADGEETADRYCVSEWWLEAGDAGPGPDSHEENVEIFYVNRSTARAGALNLFMPGGFEVMMPAIVDYFAGQS